MRYLLRALGAMAMLAGLPAAAGNLVFSSGFDTSPEGPHDPPEAARFLTQATFGPTLPTIRDLQLEGYHAWIDRQVALPPSLQLPFLDGLVDAAIAAGEPVAVYQDRRQEIWFRHALQAPDQLRQRVAFALSQVFVVSDRNGALEGNPTTLAHYYDQLTLHAFGNFRELLEAVTLHPAMGHYLSMFQNRKPDPDSNIRPDENFAREIMQLFTIGLVQLGPDGTPLDGEPGTPGVQPVPSYDQDTIRGFAHVFTGWNWSTCEPPQAPEGPGLNWWSWVYCPSTDDDSVDWLQHAGWRTPMLPWGEGTPYGDIYHDVAAAKQLLDYPGVALPGGVLPGGGGARADLEAALDNLFHHPNVGPFIGRLLIQRLTTSNPSPAYVGRVAAAFADNGAGVRGDLAAVVRAILLDPEARDPAAAPAHFGKLREPLLRITQLWRAMDARSDDGRIREGWPEYYASQAVLRSPSVFNFYLPGYSLPGEIADAGLVSPEFQITTDTQLTRMSNEIAGKVYWAFRGNPWAEDYDPVAVDLARDMAIADDAERLVERYDLLFMAGGMGPEMLDILVDHLEDMPGGSEDARRQRVQDLLWLVLTSPQYAVER